MAVRDDQKNQVQQATDLVRLIGEQVALRPKGREFAGLCPFHEDKNPSMFVSPAKQIYKCFSCGAGGDAFTFVMQYHKMTFPEALRYLAERAGIKLETHGSHGQDSDKPSERQLIAKANELALNYFRNQYADPQAGKIARDYASRRGIHPDMIEAFQIGYAPDSWDALAKSVEQQRWQRQGFELAGLVSPRKNGPGYYDRLRHRLIFPIFDAIGRPIAFGGRKLREEDEPKYLNSPETALFNKSATLYGLHLAKKPIIDRHFAVIVEGYTDVIACHQAGATNVVATLGTALTADHVRELRRYAEKVVLVFDADAAGQKASDRAVELFLTGDLDVAIAELPEGPGGAKMDPAELIAQEDGPQVWESAISAAQDALAYQFGRMRQSMASATTVTGRQKLAESYIQQLGQMGLARAGSIRKSLVIQRLSAMLHMSESAINELLQRATPAAPVRPPVVEDAEWAGVPVLEDESVVGSTEVAREDNVITDVAWADSRHKLKASQLAERQLIGCLLRQNELFEHTLADGRTLDEAIAPGDIVNADERKLYERVYDVLAEGRKLTLAGLLGDLAADQNPQAGNLATEADAEVDRATQGKPVNVLPVFEAAAQAIVDFHRQRAYRKTRSEVASTEQAAEKLLRAEQLRETLRENPSPARIFRMRS